MLTPKNKFGKGSFEEYIPEIGSKRAFRKKEMASTKDKDSSNPNPFSTEEELFSAFMAMKAMVEEMYEDRKKAKRTGGKEKMNPHNFEKRSKGKQRNKHTCSHCDKKGHEEAKCWKLHPKMKLKWDQPRNGNKNTMTMV
jgi:hypothetical protein